MVLIAFGPFKASKFLQKGSSVTFALLSLCSSLLSMQYRILMTGCWRALCFCLGQGDTPGQARHSVYRGYCVSDGFDSVLESNLTRPLLSGN